jgi:hypothetical protein
MQKRHKTTLITSNLGFSEWGSFLKNNHLTAGLIDRLTENRHVINLKNCQTKRRAMNFVDIRQRADVREVLLETVLLLRGAVPDRHDKSKWHTEQGPLSVSGPKFMNWQQGHGEWGDRLVHAPGRRQLPGGSSMAGAALRCRLCCRRGIQYAPCIPRPDFWIAVRQFLWSQSLDRFTLSLYLEKTQSDIGHAEKSPQNQANAVGMNRYSR